MIEHSVITCPHCGHQTSERMPTDACQFFYDCRGCGVVLKPKPGDCCVFCSYGSVPCPPIQATAEGSDMTMTAGEVQPIMCTLAAGDYKNRMAWIAALNREALREKRRDDLRLALTYAPEAGERVREMVRREKRCCSFLEFDLREDADAVRLTIMAPEEAREAAELLFEPFQSTSPSGM
jgi:hypothetical protein